MKVFFALVVFLLVLTASLYALAFFNVIPVQKIADSSPTAMKILIQIHLVKPKPPAPPPAKAASKKSKADDVAAKLAAVQAKLDKANADNQRFRQQISALTASLKAATAPTDSPGAPDGKNKLIAILDTMSPDDIANIFQGGSTDGLGPKKGSSFSIPDASIVSYLEALDEKKAGKILSAVTAVSPGHAAKIAELMAAPKPRPVFPVPHPLTSIQ